MTAPRHFPTTEFIIKLSKIYRGFLRALPVGGRVGVVKAVARLGANGFPIPARCENTVKGYQERVPATPIRTFPAHRSEILLRTPSPIHLEDELHPEFLRESKRMSPATFVAEIPGGRVWGDAGSIVSEDNTLLRELSPEFRKDWRDFAIIKQTYLGRPKRIAGRVASLAAPSGQAFGHWLFDVLPRLAIIEKAGLALNDFDGFFLNGTRKRYQSRMLEMLGIPREKWISSEETPHIEAENLFAPSVVGLTGNYPRWVCEWLQEKFLPFAKSVPVAGQRIFISRANAAARRIANEDDLFAALAPEGFTRIVLESHTVDEQVGLFAKADFVIGPMGSGNSAAVFCKPGTRFIETYASSAVNVFTWAFGTQLPLHFGYLLGEPIIGSAPRPHNDDYHISTEKMKRLVAAMS